MEKKRLILFAVMFFVCAATAMAWVPLYNGFNGDGDGSTWSDADNWQYDYVATDAQIALIDGAAASNVVYNMPSYTLGGVEIARAASGGKLIVNGGSLDTTGLSNKYISVGHGAGYSGSFEMNAGDVLSYNTFIGNAGTGTFDINNGKLICQNAFSVGHAAGSSGVANLYGGTVETKILLISLNGTGLINIENGSLVLKRADLIGDDQAWSDLQGIVSGYIANDLIVGYNGTGGIETDWDDANRIATITAVVPEPATMTLLALGSFAMIRRKR